MSRNLDLAELSKYYALSPKRAGEVFGVTAQRIKYHRNLIADAGGVKAFGVTKHWLKPKRKSKPKVHKPKAVARKPAPVVKLPEVLTVKNIYTYRKMSAKDLALASGKSVREVLIMRDQLNKIIAAHLAKQRNS